ncbi:hypothetical protein SDC9_205196 [bioreactor metagenome]|uniref:Uncharacterized protein n=1 Tax=bioreactor metagenome TaxID=1076179 RepID=A0A645J313_9ZZZZ
MMGNWFHPLTNLSNSITIDANRHKGSSGRNLLFADSHVEFVLKRTQALSGDNTGANRIFIWKVWYRGSGAEQVFLSDNDPKCWFWY